MLNKINQNIPSNSVSYMLICGGIIVLIGLLLIIPFYRYNAGIANESKSIQQQIDEQKELTETYQFLKIAKAKKQTYALPNPAGEKLSKQDMSKFPEAFRFETEKSGMTTASLVLDTKTMTGQSQSLMYNATVKGDFADFRRLLIRLGDLPYIDQIEEISIKQDRDNMEFKLKIWIALAG